MNLDNRKMYRCRCPTCVQHPKSETAKRDRAINNLLVGLDEKSRRHCVGALALERGWGGISALHRITGLSRKTLQRGRDELLAPEPADLTQGVRYAGGGRPTVEKNIRPS
jgi:hypothetical protein